MARRRKLDKEQEELVTVGADRKMPLNAVIGQLYGGETVLFYGLEEGWDKIECNGIVGYIGPKFLQ